MESLVGWLFLVCFHLLLFHFSFSHSLCHLHDKIALLQFKTSLTCPDSYIYIDDNDDPKTATWENGTDCCSWLGVTCHPISGHVIGLDVSCSGLCGDIHPNSTLFHLSHLQSLNLAFNYFSNSSFSSFFGGFVSLTHLNLSYSISGGKIPSQISQLSKLESLDLSYNFLTWKESSWKKFLQNATVLRELILDHIDMSSCSMRLLNLSTSLVTLSLVRTRLGVNMKNDMFCLPKLQRLHWSGGIYQLPNLSCSAASLTILDLSMNFLEGSIPDSFSNLTHLTSLDLSYNYFNDSIPSSLLTLPHLTFLVLEFNQFSGQIPNVFLQSSKFEELYLRYNNIGGELPSTLSNLQHLVHLDLSENQFSGQIPSSFSNLQHLVHLDLSDNQFSGQIPSSFSNLQHLVHLDLSENQFSGQIPSSFSNLQHLVHLDLSDNQFSGQIPSSFSNLQHLVHLDLSENKFSGQIPSSLLNLQDLIFLDLSKNKLEGPLPNKIRGLSNLTSSSLSYNLLNGTVPGWCLSLPSLLDLHLSNNQFTGHISAISSLSLKYLYLCNNKLQGNIPQSIFTLVNLTELCLSSNNFSGPDIYAFFIDADYFPCLEILDLSSTGLTEFPKLSGKVPKLIDLNLSNNKLNGTVPDWLHEMVSLQILDLSRNFLIGGISSLMCNASSIQILDLSHNKLTGIIPPCLANLQQLLFLDLQMNKFNGTLPGNFSENYNLNYLNLNGNQLQGPLPESLSNCKDLIVLNLGNNQIKGKFPCWLQTLSYLKVLVLRANKLHGPILSLDTESEFRNLIIFDISSNNFNGLIPKAYIQNFEAMKNVVQEYHQEYITTLRSSTGIEDPVVSVTLTTKAMSMTFDQIPINLVAVDLSSNKFEGEIPSVIGELNALKVLNLSHNRLSGPIPQSMKNLTNLESLDLSSNKLRGRIPTELANLNFLEVLNLSHNHLVGEIPQGKQFNTFSEDSYEGNLGLCGVPLSVKCNGDIEEQSPSSPSFWGEERFGFGWEAVVIGYGCGVVFGIGMGFCVLLVGKPQWLVKMVGGGLNIKKVKRKSRM